MPNFLHLTVKATDYKINPEKDNYKESSTKLWFDTVEICDKVLRYAIKKDMGVTFNTYVEFQKKYLRHQKIRKKYYNALLSYSIYRNMITLPRSYKFLSLRLVKKFKIPWKHIIYSIIPLIYFSLSRNYHIDGIQLNQARNMLSLFKKLKSPNEDPIKEWEYLKEQTFDLWYSLCY